MPFLAQPAAAKAFWNWDTSIPADPMLVAFPNNAPTKSGVTAGDLRSFAGVPIQTYGTPPTPIPDSKLTEWIRQAEDYIEQTTGLLLCPTFVSSPPVLTATAAAQAEIAPTSPDGRMRLGTDFDLEDAGYDFKIEAFMGEGWGIQQLRYRPLRNLSDVDATAIKSVVFTYPLLSQFFPVAPSWYVEDKDHAMVRLVPSQNIQMLPLYQLQLSIGGFAGNLPGGISVQYTAGLTRADYSTRFSFVRLLVVAKAAMTALSSTQGGINQGLAKQMMLVDGVQYSGEYDKNGPYAGLIANFGMMVDDLLGKARDLIGGPMMVTL